MDKNNLQQKHYYNSFKDILDVWIYQYLKRHDLECIEINYKNRIVTCYHKNCNNIFEDYFCFNYNKIDIFN